MEHRGLKLSQVKRKMDNIDGKIVACYVYTECGFKNNQGGFASLNLRNKVVKQHEVDSDRCHVKILDKYLKLLSPDDGTNVFTINRSLAEVPSDSSMPWFTNIPIGKNTLGAMMKKMSEKAG